MSEQTEITYSGEKVAKNGILVKEQGLLEYNSELVEIVNIDFEYKVSSNTTVMTLVFAPISFEKDALLELVNTITLLSKKVGGYNGVKIEYDLNYNLNDYMDKITNFNLARSLGYEDQHNFTILGIEIKYGGKINNWERKWILPNGSYFTTFFGSSGMYIDLIKGVIDYLIAEKVKQK